MKAKTQLLAAILLAVSSLAPAWAQNFDAGSNGSLGALNVADADVTVDLPPDGRLQYTTITVAAGRTLSFKRNPLNTPVYLLAQGDVVIDGTINVSGFQAPGSPPIGGAAGPGGFDGGKPGFGAEFGPGDGYGPGGGSGGNNDNSSNGAGAGVYAVRAEGSERHGNPYGTPLLIPLMGGSGGGGIAGQPGRGGGGGGGALLIAANTRIAIGASGRVLSQGGGRANNPRNAGSGGAIRLTLTPDNGPRIVIDTNIVNTAQNPATLVIPVGLPVNNLITIHAWTR